MLLLSFFRSVKIDHEAMRRLTETGSGAVQAEQVTTQQELLTACFMSLQCMLSESPRPIPSGLFAMLGSGREQDK